MFPWKTCVRIGPFLMFIFSFCDGQSILEERYSADSGTSFSEFVEAVESTNPIRFYFREDWVRELTLKTSAERLTLKSILERFFSGTDVQYVVVHEYMIILMKPTGKNEKYEALREVLARDKKPVEQIRLDGSERFETGKPVVLSGFVLDGDRNPLPFATVYDLQSENGVSCASDGSYRINVLSGRNLLSFKYAGYEEKIIDLTIGTNKELNVQLTESAKMLDEVVISDNSLLRSSIGNVVIDLTDLRRSPTMLGEKDIIRQIQTEAGITTVGEVSSGFNVRGGSVDQNLVLYDGVQIFNSSHALGFFTSVNAETLGEVKLYKGNVPAEYGGRISSVLNLRTKNGSVERWSARAGIGIASSNIAIGGPIKKGSSSVMASFRTSYSDWMLKLFNSNYVALHTSTLSFFDGSLKLATRISDKSQLTASMYVSGDRFRLANDSTFHWSTRLATVRYDFGVNDRLSASISGSMAEYTYVLDETNYAAGYSLENGVRYPSLNIDFVSDGRHRVGFGFQNTFYKINPGRVSPLGENSVVLPKQIVGRNAIESGMYVNDVFRVGRKMELEGGLRLSAYHRLGAGVGYRYEESRPREYQYVIDSLLYGSREIRDQQFGIEPRFSMRYELGNMSTLKFGYSRIFQYIHLLSNTASVSPIDTWHPGDEHIKPERADQFSVGYFANIKSSRYSFSLEAFYKILDQLPDFKDNGNIVMNPHPEQVIVQGIGKAYGVEFSLKVERERLSADVNYTWSRSLRKVAGIVPEESVNEGKWYPSNFDQPHVVNAALRYDVTRRIFLSANFSYKTGRPVSGLISSYRVDNISVLNFSERNSLRLPDYHRLDVALVVEGNHRKNQKFKGSWAFSFYNVYARKNPYSAFFQEDQDGTMRAYRLAVIGTVIPTVTYILSFNRYE